MFKIILLLTLVDLQRSVTMVSARTKTNLILSKIEKEQETLSLRMDIFQEESIEMWNMIETLNSSCYYEIHKQENVSFIDHEDVSKKCVEKALGNNRKLDKILKAFQDEKKFYRKTLGESKILRENFRQELEDYVDTTLSARHQDENRNASLMIEDLERRFEKECDARGLKITALESEITALKQNSETEIRNLKEQYSNLENELKLFRENVTDNFVTEEKFSELQKMHSGPDDTQKLLSQCSGSWVLNSNMKTCFLFVTKGKTWHGADRFCKNHGGQLVEIQNGKKQEHLKQMYEESGLYWGYDWTSFWAGGSDISSEGSWRWSVSGKRFTWSNWDRYYSEPNGGSSENCLSILLSYNYFQWNDEYCTYELPFICEKILS